MRRAIDSAAHGIWTFGGGGVSRVTPVADCILTATLAAFHNLGPDSAATTGIGPVDRYLHGCWVLILGGGITEHLLALLRPAPANRTVQSSYRKPCTPTYPASLRSSRAVDRRGSSCSGHRRRARWWPAAPCDALRPHQSQPAALRLAAPTRPPEVYAPGTYPLADTSKAQQVKVPSTRNPHEWFRPTETAWNIPAGVSACSNG